jgi:hypothetical protein
MAIHVRRGTTRAVLVLGRLAIKVPRNRVGFDCNRYEATIWKVSQGSPERRARLCPVLWSGLGCLVLAMAAAAPLPPGVVPTDEWADFWEYNPIKGASDSWPGEFKPEDWGIIDGRYVLVDYGAPAS